MSVALLGAFVQEMNPIAAAVAPMTIGNVTTNTGTSATTMVLNVPTGTVDGDVLLAFFSRSSSGATTTTVPSGWSAITNPSATDGWAILMHSANSEPASYTFTLGAGLLHSTGALVDVKNAQSTLDGTLIQNSGTSTSAINGSYTPAQSNTGVFGFIAINASSNAAQSASWTAPLIKQTDVQGVTTFSSYGTSAFVAQSAPAGISAAATLATSQTWHFSTFGLLHA